MIGKGHGDFQLVGEQKITNKFLYDSLPWVVVTWMCSLSDNPLSSVVEIFGSFMHAVL